MFLQHIHYSVGICASFSHWHRPQDCDQVRISVCWRQGWCGNDPGLLSSGTISSSIRLSEYRVRRKCLRFWLEWVRGTMKVRDLAIKCTSYAYYIAYCKWARVCSMLPLLVCIAPDIGQERCLVRVVQARLIQDHGLVLGTTTEVLLKEYGPLTII